MEPLVSIILPTYNRGKMIIPSIESVLNQSYKKWELIIVDDASTDNTDVIIQQYIENNPNIIYHKLQVNGGACVARNAGINLSKGEYVSFLDSDDEYFPEKIRMQVDCFSKSKIENIGVVSCGRADYKDNIKYFEWVPNFKGDILNNLLKKDRVGAGTPFLMLKKSVIIDNNLFFDPMMPAGQDWDFLVRVCQHVNFDFVAKPLVKVNHHSGERVYTNERALIALDIQYNKYKSLLTTNPDVHDKFVLKKAQLNFLYGKHAKAVSIIDNEILAKKMEVKLWQAYLKLFKSYRGFLSLATYKLLTKLTATTN